MKLSREEVLHIAALAKVGVTEADVEKFQRTAFQYPGELRSPAKTGYLRMSRLPLNPSPCKM